jgi:hypothetical protein
MRICALHLRNCADPISSSSSRPGLARIIGCRQLAKQDRIARANPFHILGGSSIYLQTL